MSPRGARLTGLILAIALGQFLYVWTRSAWINYWLLEDAQKGSAIVTKELWSGHNMVIYRYFVDQREYTGKSARNSDDKNYSKAQIGEESVVYFSTSHPWLSLLYMPRRIWEGLPVTIIVLILESMALVTLANPSSGWAFNLMEEKHRDEK